MQVERYDTADALAAVLAERVARAIGEKPDLVLGLPAGRTPILLYRRLVAESQTRGLDWSRVRTFNIDEFITSANGGMLPFQRFMHEHLLGHVKVAAGHADFPNGNARDLSAECDRYERAIAAAGGLDLLLLGIGTNGHIGFNEPGASFLARTHRARLEPDSRAANAYLFGDRADDVPEEALTMGLATMIGARAIVLVATGQSKAGAVATTVDQPITTALPASFLQLHPRVAVMVDQAAASALQSTSSP